MKDETMQKMSRSNFILHPSSFILLLALASSGCGLGSVIGKAIPQNIAPAYSGLQGHSVGILVWADRGIMIDWGSIQLDLANSVQDQLVKSGAAEVKGTTWPYPPASYVKYMRDHPGLESTPITEIAPKWLLTADATPGHASPVAPPAEAGLTMMSGSDDIEG